MYWYVHTFWAVVTIDILVCACYKTTEVSSSHSHWYTIETVSSTACKEDCFLGRLWLSQVRHCLAIYDQLAKGLAIMSVTFAVFVHGPWWVFLTIKQYAKSWFRWMSNRPLFIGLWKKKIRFKFTCFLINLQALILKV